MAFEKILKNLEKGEKSFVSFFGHFIFSHAPVYHDENCKFTGLESFPASEKAIINQTQCVIDLMKKVINVLKKNNIYDQSLIIFKSDHGKPTTFYKKDSLRGQPIFNDNNKWGYDRYRPFLMIKEISNKAENLEIINKMFYLSELSEYYCKIGLPKKKVKKNICNELSDELNEKYGISGKYKKYIFVPKLTTSNIFDGHHAFENPNQLNEMKKMFKEWAPN